MSRVRVAISPNPSNSCIHFGHLRTIYIGYLIAQQKDIPFHIRIDVPFDTFIMHGDITDPIVSIDTVCNIANICSYLNIIPDKTYRIREKVATKNEFDEVFKDKSDVMWKIINLPVVGPQSYQSALLDDVMDYPDTVIVRGVEFKYPDLYFDPLGLSANKNHIHMEGLLWKASGANVEQINLPLVLLGGRKLSKTETRLVPWDVVSGLSSQLIKQFLVSSIMLPLDPFDENVQFDYKSIPENNYEWSWQIWNELTSKHGGRNAHSISG